MTREELNEIFDWLEENMNKDGLLIFEVMDQCQICARFKERKKVFAVFYIKEVKKLMERRRALPALKNITIDKTMIDSNLDLSSGFTIKKDENTDLCFVKNEHGLGVFEESRIIDSNYKEDKVEDISSFGMSSKEHAEHFSTLVKEGVI